MSAGSAPSGSGTTRSSSLRPAARRAARSIASCPARSASRHSTSVADRALEDPDLLLGERGAHDRHGAPHPGLVEREHVGVPLDEDHPAAARCGGAGEVDAEQLRALVVELAVGGVQVLRPLVFAHRPGTEAVDSPAGVGRREQHPLAEAVVQAPGLGAGDEADRQQLLVAEAGRAGAGEDAVPGAGRVADTELAQRLLAEPAPEQVLARRRGLLRLPQVARVVRRRPVEQRVEPLVTLGGARRRPDPRPRSPGGRRSGRPGSPSRP